jgi:hypothetical protein
MSEAQAYLRFDLVATCSLGHFADYSASKHTMFVLLPDTSTSQTAKINHMRSKNKVYCSCLDGFLDFH